jgi:YD repeat-containing protein
MNTLRDWFVIIGLMIALLLGVSTYFLFQDHNSGIKTVASPTVVNAPMVSPSPTAMLPPSPADTLPSPQPQASSGFPSTYQYNAKGQLQCISYPDGSVYIYQYDAYGDKIREITRTGQTWTYVYDQNHHPLSILYPDGRVTHPETAPSTPDAH